MTTTTIFKNGNSQAVRIPKKFRFEENEVTINKIGDAVMLVPKNSKYTNFLLGLNLFSEDFANDMQIKLPYDKRENL